MSSIQIQNHQTPIGEMVIGAYKEQICLCDWKYRKRRGLVDKRIKDFLKADFEESSSSIIEETKRQLQEYFEKERKQFTLPLLLCGTEFQQLVWKELLKIPYGVIETYLGLSHKMNNEKAIRAIASSNGANALAIIIPCHRVIGSKGELVGYAGGTDNKNKLLQLESGIIQTKLIF